MSQTMTSLATAQRAKGGIGATHPIPGTAAEAGPFKGVRRLMRRGSEHFWFVLLLGLLPLFAYGIGLTVHFSDQQDEIADRRVQQAAVRAAHAVDRAIQAQLGLLEGLAVSTAVDRKDFAALRTEMERLWRLHPEWRTVILTDDARMLINLRYPPGVELPEIRDPGSLRKAWTTQKAEVGDLRNGRASFRVPVVRQAETKYTIVAAIEPELFNAALASSRLPDEWTGLLVDSDGILAGRSTDAAGPTGSSVADKIALLGKPDEQGIFRTVEAGETYIAGARVGATRWHVLVEVPTALVKRQVIETRFAVWSAAGAAAIFALVLTGLLLRQWATRREVVRLAETNVALTRAVAEKDILLAEVYHRVKNNLQLVEALMALHSADFSDQKSREAWQAIRRRISALGLVHQQLLHSDDLAHFDLRPFLADLCGNIERAFAPEERDVRIVVDVESIAVDLDFAIPLGLLVNEFVSNAFKHAFPPASDGRRPRGEIRVRVDRPAEDRVRLVIADNGVGGWTKDEPGSAPQQPSVGLQISQSLVAQLRGTLAIRGDEGTTIELVMPAPTARKQKVGADAARKG